MDLEKYLAINLFDELRMTEMTAAEKEAFVKAFTDVINQRIVRHLADVLSPDQQAELTEIFSGEEGEKAANEFLKIAVPDFDEIIKEEIAGYKKELIDIYHSQKNNDGEADL